MEGGTGQWEERGVKKWDNCNSKINKIDLKKDVSICFIFYSIPEISLLFFPPPPKSVTYKFHVTPLPLLL